MSFNPPVTQTKVPGWGRSSPNPEPLPTVGVSCRFLWESYEVLFCWFRVSLGPFKTK